MNSDLMKKSNNLFTRTFSTSRLTKLSVLFAWYASLINYGWGDFSLGVKCSNPGWPDYLMNQSSIAVYLSASIINCWWTISFCLGVICPQIMVYACLSTSSLYLVWVHCTTWLWLINLKKGIDPMMDLWAPPVCVKMHPKGQIGARNIQRRSRMLYYVVVRCFSVLSNTIYVMCSGNWPVANLFAMSNCVGLARIAIGGLIATNQHEQTRKPAALSDRGRDNISIPSRYFRQYWRYI